VQFQPLTILYSLNPVFNHEPSENLSLLNFWRAHVFTRGILDKIEPFPSVLVSTPPVDGLVKPHLREYPALFSLLVLEPLSRPRPCQSCRPSLGPSGPRDRAAQGGPGPSDGPGPPSTGPTGPIGPVDPTLHTIRSRRTFPDQTTQYYLAPSCCILLHPV